MILWLKGAWLAFKGSALAVQAVKWGAIALGVLLVVLKVRQSGRDSATREMAETIVRRSTEANNARNEVRDAHERGKPPPKKVDKFYID